MNNLLDDYALASPLRHSNNWVKLTVVAAGVLGGVSAASPVTPLFIAACMGFAAVVLAKVPVKFLFKADSPASGFCSHRVHCHTILLWLRT